MILFLRFCLYCQIFKRHFSKVINKTVLRDTSFNLAYAECHEDIFSRYRAVVSVILQDINNCWTVDGCAAN